MIEYDIGSRIKKYRMQQSMTQEQLAEELDLSVTYVGMLERGERSPSLDTFIQIADILQVTPDELLCGVTKKGYLERLAKYEERVAGLSLKDTRTFYRIMEAFLDM